MDFDQILDRAIDMLQRRGRLTYRALKLQFDLDDVSLDVLKDELIEGQRLARDEAGKVLVWTADAASTPYLAVMSEHPSAPVREPLSYTPPHLAEKILTSRSALEGERKQVTVLFCDLQDSTPLAEKIGPENMHALLNRFFELALSEIHRYEGTINQFLGDGFMALFGAPVSHEDHARGGVLAAIGLQRGLKELNPGEPYGVKCRFRIGINSGPVVVASIGDNLRMDYTAVGDTTNLASRLQGIAEPGEILVSESTSRLAQGYVRQEALQPVQVKGKTEPVPLYKVIGALPRRSPVIRRGERTLSQFVGRERELALLDERFEQVKSGHGQIVGIVAEAGQGKSRLLYEFRQRLQDKQVTYLEGRCLSYGQTIPYHPIIDVVRNNCDITDADSPETITEKVRFALQEVGMDAEASAPYLLQLLGVKEGTESIALLTPDAIRARTFETLKQMSLMGSQRQPLIFEIEDLHWIDQTSQDYLASWVESLPGAPILLLTTYRPGYRPQWLDKSYSAQIALHHLTSQDGLTIIHSALHGEKLSDEVERMIIDKAEGNPFFLEELTRSIVERDNLQADTIVPDTIQGVLAARIDRLPENPKRLLQTASVLGREFSPRLLEAICEGADSLNPMLGELKQLEFLFERAGAEEPIYVFKHALTQDVAYESLLTTRRQDLHTAAGQALEVLYAARLEQAYDQLAYHYARTDNAAKAVAYLTLAAERAAARSAHTEAITTIESALAHAERLPCDERDPHVVVLYIRQIESLFWAGRRQEAVNLHLQRKERLERFPDHALVGKYYGWLTAHHTYLGAREGAVHSAHRAIEAAQQCHDDATMGLAYTWLAGENFFAGRLLQSVEQSQRAVTLLDGTAERHWFGVANYVLAYTYHGIGDFERVIATVARIEAVAETIGDRRRQSSAFEISGLSLAKRGDWAEGIAACQRALELAPDPYQRAIVLGFLGYAYLAKGDLAEAIRTLELAVPEAMQYRSRQIQVWIKTFLGEAYHLNGQLVEAHDLSSQADKLAREIQHEFGVGMAQRVLGRIAHTRGKLDKAATHLHEARDIFASIQARFELGRTLLDLASLAHAQGNRNAVADHLSQACAWFKNLQTPKWAERTEQLAQEYDVTLAEVELADLMEGTS